MNSAIVTGGARGLGAATARALSSKGFYVFIWDVNDTAGEALAAELGGHDRAQYIHVDVSSEDLVAAALRSMDKPLHVVVNAAGVTLASRILSGNGRVHGLQSFERVMRINVTGTFNVMRLAAAKMSEQPTVDEHKQRGVIINISSIAAFEGQTGQAAYAASKGAIASLTLPVARELSRFGIRVITIAPGLFATPMLTGSPEKAKQSLHKEMVFSVRFGEPAEFAQLVVDVVGNPMVNGTTIRIDGALRLSKM
eukprot:PhM_4_TR1980/c0_g1_i2/m.68909